MAYTVDDYIQDILDELTVDNYTQDRIQNDLKTHISSAYEGEAVSSIIKKMGYPHYVAKELMNNLYEYKMDVLSNMHGKENTKIDKTRIWAVVFGVLSILIPYVGIVFAICGIRLAVSLYRKGERRLFVWSLLLCIIGILIQFFFVLFGWFYSQ